MTCIIVRLWSISCSCPTFTSLLLSAHRAPSRQLFELAIHHGTIGLPQYNYSMIISCSCSMPLRNTAANPPLETFLSA
ncbi:hypothetical protein C8F04DRAFT_1146727 [Mycena alexandri]|uniref:Uncharacterized protein n=1 Tax=Mycena alexandri TaxID=1745969 RepID=A0AAD6WNY2_9AGAR|nr:hypothetical protein C8F04DRAFT_1146727 [Mycena alexandri]